MKLASLRDGTTQGRELVAQAWAAPNHFTDDTPLMYQGASDDLLPASGPSYLPDERHDIDLEAEVAVIVDDVDRARGQDPPLECRHDHRIRHGVGSGPASRIRDAVGTARGRENEPRRAANAVSEVRRPDRDRCARRRRTFHVWQNRSSSAAQHVRLGDLACWNTFRRTMCGTCRPISLC